MINLLSPVAKKNFVAGRVNALLVRYLWIVGALFILLGVICGLTYFMLDGTKVAKEQLIKDNEAKMSEYQPVQQRATQFQTNLATSKAILDKQTYYSGALLKISKYLIKGTVISTITLDNTTYGTPMTIQVLAVDPYVAINLKKSLQDSGIFSDVHFQVVDLPASGQTVNDVKYGASLTMQVTINKDGIGNESY